MNMPDIEALKELIKEMGGMDYERLKGQDPNSVARPGEMQPGMTKVEMETTIPMEGSESELAKAVMEDPNAAGMADPMADQNSAVMEGEMQPAMAGVEGEIDPNEEEEVAEMLRKRFGR